MRDPAAQVEWIVRNFEGGDIFTNHPLDTGGATRAGITLRTWQHYRRQVTGDKTLVCTPAELKAAPLAALIDCGVDVFVMESGIGMIEDPWLRFSLTDYAFHSGWVQAIKGLQRTIPGLHDDGVIGRITLGATNKHPAPRVVAAAVVAHRQDLMLDRVTSKPDQREWLLGWMNRTTAVLGIVTDGNVPGRPAFKI